MRIVTIALLDAERRRPGSLQHLASTLERQQVLALSKGHGAGDNVTAAISLHFLTALSSGRGAPAEELIVHLALRLDGASHEMLFKLVHCIIILQHDKQDWSEFDELRAHFLGRRSASRAPRHGSSVAKPRGGFCIKAQVSMPRSTRAARARRQQDQGQAPWRGLPGKTRRQAHEVGMHGAESTRHPVSPIRRSHGAGLVSNGEARAASSAPSPSCAKGASGRHASSHGMCPRRLLRGSECGPPTDWRVSARRTHCPRSLGTERVLGARRALPTRSHGSADGRSRARFAPG